MTTGMPSKGEILTAIERERAEWETALAAVGEPRMTEPDAFGAWSFKDLVAHLNGWQARKLARLEAAAGNRPEPADPSPADLGDDTDAINAWIDEHNRDRLLADVIEESREHFARLAEVVQLLPEAALADPRRFAWLEGVALGPAIVDGGWFEHWHEEHEPAVRAWLAAG